MSEQSIEDKAPLYERLVLVNLQINYARDCLLAWAEFAPPTSQREVNKQKSFYMEAAIQLEVAYSMLMAQELCLILEVPEQLNKEFTRLNYTVNDHGLAEPYKSGLIKPSSSLILFDREPNQEKSEIAAYEHYGFIGEYVDLKTIADIIHCGGNFSTIEAYRLLPGLQS